MHNYSIEIILRIANLEALSMEPTISFDLLTKDRRNFCIRITNRHVTFPETTLLIYIRALKINLTPKLRPETRLHIRLKVTR